MEEKQDEILPVPKNMWMKKSKASFESDKKTRTHLDSFMAEIKQTGVAPEGTVLCNCETTCSNDISLLYPWLHITDTLLDIKTWLRRQTNRINGSIPAPPPPLLAGSLGRHGKLESTSVTNMRIVQGTYCMVETVISEHDISPMGEQLTILLGFRTTSKPNGQVKKVEFMECHTSNCSEVFQYLVLLHVSAGSQRGKVGVLDCVDRFRAGNMSGYVTVYSDLTTRAMASNLVMV